MNYAKSLVAATPSDQLVKAREKRPRGLTEAQMATMQRESENLDRELKLIQNDYGAEHLDLVLATGYVGRLLGNARVVRHLAQHHPDILAEFQRITEVQQVA